MQIAGNKPFYKKALLSLAFSNWREVLFYANPRPKLISHFGSYKGIECLKIKTILLGSLKIPSLQALLFIRFLNGLRKFFHQIRFFTT